MSGNTVITKEIEETLLLAIARPEHMPPKKMAALHESIMQRLVPRNTAPCASDLAWQSPIAGVRIKLLYDSGKAFTHLLRMEAGATLPGRLMAQFEEYLVLEGEACIDGTPLKTDDFHHTPRSAPGKLLTTTAGVLLYIRSKR